MFIVIKRYREQYAPGNQMVEPYWEYQGYPILFRTLAKATTWLNATGEDIPIYFTPHSPMTISTSSQGLHWRVMEVEFGQQIDFHIQ